MVISVPNPIDTEILVYIVGVPLSTCVIINISIKTTSPSKNFHAEEHCQFCVSLGLCCKLLVTLIKHNMLAFLLMNTEHL